MRSLDWAPKGRGWRNSQMVLFGMSLKRYLQTSQGRCWPRGLNQGIPNCWASCGPQFAILRAFQPLMLSTYWRYNVPMISYVNICEYNSIIYIYTYIYIYIYALDVDTFPCLCVSPSEAVRCAALKLAVCSYVVARRIEVRLWEVGWYCNKVYKNS